MMPKKEWVSDEHKNMPFFICRLERAVYHTGSKENILEVWLNRNNFIDASSLDARGLAKNSWLEGLRVGKNPHAQFVKKQLERRDGEIVIADGEHPIRWVGSGGLLILKDKKGGEYAVLNRRHPLASWPGHIDANGGYSSSVADMCFPGELGERELKEEVIIKQKGKRIPLNITPRHIPGATTVIVHFKGQEFVTPDLILVIDSNTGVIDFRRVYEMEIGNFFDYSFEDGEKRHTGENIEVSQGREIFVIRLKNLISRFKKKEDKFTPALSAILERL